MPVPTVELIPHLVDNLRAAGEDVDLVMNGDEPITDPAVSVAAYRVAQEALTNAHRHGCGRIQVRVNRKKGILTVEIENGRVMGSPHPHETSGFGVVGMRERVEAAGGRFELMAYPRHFHVRATMRIDGSTL
ncbi:hypothetical protein M1D93_17490 [Arthrobacter sp. Z1-9]